MYLFVIQSFKAFKKIFFKDLSNEHAVGFIDQ